VLVLVTGVAGLAAIQTGQAHRLHRSRLQRVSPNQGTGRGNGRDVSQDRPREERKRCGRVGQGDEPAVARGRQGDVQEEVQGDERRGEYGTRTPSRA